MKTKSLNVIDLFSGAGGLSLGFVNAGFETLFAVEINKTFASTYAKNFYNTTLICDDIKRLTAEKISELVGSKNIDLVIGGPPCQGFSMAGKIARNFIDDERNYLFKEFVRIVSIVKPKFFLMENVANLLTHNNGNTIKEIVSAFESIGYKVEYRVLNSVDYEVPQERRRIFIVGNRIGKTFAYPQKKNKIITVEDAIKDLPQLASGEHSDIPNHTAMRHSVQMLKKMSYINDGGDKKEIPIEIRPKSGDARKYIRYASNKPSVCVTGDMRKIFHYSQNRALTARELARLQTFPDSFEFMGSSISVQQQIGNAVPPRLAKEIALKIKELLDE